MAQIGRWLPILWNNMSVPSSSVEQCEKNTGSRWMHRGQCEVWLVFRKLKGRGRGIKRQGRKGIQQDKGRKK